jgi:hypothetical protein
MSSDPSPAAFGFRPEHVVEMFLRGYAGKDVPTLDELQRSVQSLLVGPFASLQPCLEQIVQEILRRIDVRIGAALILDNSAGHEPWLDELNRVGWRLWPRLQGYLRDQERLPSAVLAELDRSTDQALSRLESPNRGGRWDRRGLVVGHVQSGKTTHYTALAGKAIDAGYRIVIILAGIHNSLRSQTHERIDRHLIGRDSCALQFGDPQTIRLAGVGEYSRDLGLPDVPFSILTCTTAADNGDFKTQTASQVWFQVNEGARLVMVVKKNATILRKLRDWLRVLLADQNSAEPQRLIHHPTLFIDDEADQASINTKDPDQDPSAINGLIRELLTSFARSGFVGYTATPFANIFIDPSSQLDRVKYGPDLFPKSFIVSLKAPSDYVGPSVVFGHPGDDSVGLSPQEALPMYLDVRDTQPWVPTPHKKDHVPGSLPESLREAMRLFVLNCAARAVRGDVRVHNSMLIHATRFVAVQNRVAEQVQQEVSTIQSLLALGSETTRSEQEVAFQNLWNQRIVAAYPAFSNRLKDRCSPLPEWKDVWEQVPAAVSRIRVMKINGSSDDALAYARASEGLSVIAVGGDKLSRGLTLEGLSVSYFLRTSNMFDTLMQMGRWFGYRPRYADLCRVYTTPGLYSAFREIALAIDDLRADLDRMALANRTPEDFGLRVRTPSDGLLITAGNKLRRGEAVQVRFAGELVQALQMPATGSAADANREAMRRLIESLPAPKRSIRGASTPHFIWHNVPASQVVEFLTAYDAYRTHSFLNCCEQLRRYIQERLARDELTTWTVCLVSKNPGPNVRTTAVGVLTVPLIKRAPDSERVIPPEHFAAKAVAGREEEASDLSLEQYNSAVEATKDEERLAGKTEAELSRSPAREKIRAERSPQNGLLLLYPIDRLEAPTSDFVVSAGISFPDSPTADALTYTVNDVWRSEYGFTGDWDDNG